MNCYQKQDPQKLLKDQLNSRIRNISDAVRQKEKEIMALHTAQEALEDLKDFYECNVWKQDS